MDVRSPHPAGCSPRSTLAPTSRDFRPRASVLRGLPATCPSQWPCGFAQSVAEIAWEQRLFGARVRMRVSACAGEAHGQPSSPSCHFRAVFVRYAEPSGPSAASYSANVLPDGASEGCMAWGTRALPLTRASLCGMSGPPRSAAPPAGPGSACSGGGSQVRGQRVAFQPIIAPLLCPPPLR